MLRALGQLVRNWIGRAALSVLDQAMVGVGQLALHVILARSFAPAEYGLFALAYSIFVFLSGFHVAVLLDPMSILGPAKHRDHLGSYVRLLIRTHLATTLLISGILVLIGTGIMAGGRDRWAILFIGPGLAIPSIPIFWIVRRVAYIQSQPWLAVLISGVQTTVLLAALLGAGAAHRLSPLTAFGALGAASAVAALLGWPFLRLERRTREPAPRAVLSEHWSYGKWAGGVSLLFWVSTGVYPALITALRGLHDAAGFRAMQNLMLPAQQILAALALPLVPWMAERFEAEGRAYPRRVFGKTLAVHLAVVLAYCSAVVGCSPWLIRAAYGNGFYETFRPLVVGFALWMSLITVAHCSSILLRSVRRPEAIFAAQLVSAVLTLLASAPLLSRHGLTGALACASLASAAEAAVLTTLLLRPGPFATVARKLARAAILVRRWSEYRGSVERPGLWLRDLLAWAQSLVLRRDPLRSGLPWFPFCVHRWLISRLTPGARVFEWGSGASTLFLARLGACVTSVEHDAGWAQRVQIALAAAGLRQTQVRFVPPEPDGEPTSDPEDLVRSFRSTDPQSRRLRFRDYAMAIHNVPDGSQDLVIIDGRARLSCLWQSREKVRTGGVILLDDSQRAEYAQVDELLPAPEWIRLRFEGPGPRSIWPGFWQTTAFIRASSPTP